MARASSVRAILWDKMRNHSKMSTVFGFEEVSSPRRIFWGPCCILEELPDTSLSHRARLL